MKKEILLELLSSIPDDEEVSIIIDPESDDEIHAGDVHDIEDAGGFINQVGYVIRTKVKE